MISDERLEHHCREEWAGVYQHPEILAMARELRAARKGFDRLRKLVDSQALDEGLWFIANTAPEAYLQHRLRELHGLIEHLIKALTEYREVTE